MFHITFRDHKNLNQYSEHDNESFANLFNLDRRNVKKFGGSSWLLIFHHDSIGEKYFTPDNCKYNIDPQLYSIIDDEELYSQSYKKFGSFYFLLEYPEVSTYQIFMQKAFITANLSDVGYKKVFGDDWNLFNGLALSNGYNYSYIDGTPGHSFNYWFYSIGAWSHQYKPRIPGPIFNNDYTFVYNVNLWIMIPKTPTLDCKFIFNFRLLLISVFIIM